MKVNFYATLRDLVGTKTLEVDVPEQVTIQALLNEITRAHPHLRHELLDEQGKLHRHLHLFVNGRATSFLDNGFETGLEESDVVSIFPPVGGG